VLILAAQWLVPVVLVAQVLREVIVYQLLPDGTLLLTTNKTEDFLVPLILMLFEHVNWFYLIFLGKHDFWICNYVHRHGHMRNSLHFVHSQFHSS
jgi:hypothetical protein